MGGLLRIKLLRNKRISGDKSDILCTGKKQNLDESMGILGELNMEILEEWKEIPAYPKYMASKIFLTIQIPSAIFNIISH